MRTNQSNTLSERLLDIGVESATSLGRPFDHCAMGVLERFGMDEPVVLYDKAKVISRLTRRPHHMSDEEAEEYYNYNILGAWVGEGTPAFLTRLYTPQTVEEMRALVASALNTPKKKKKKNDDE